VRNVLLLIYISAVLAVGFSPIVRLIERQKVLPIGTRRFPRWLAILVLYLVIIGALTGVGFLIVPPLVDQGQQLWAALPGMFERGQAFLIERGLLDHPLTVREAVERAPVGGSTDAVGTVFGTIIGFVGGIFGFLTILILTFYLLVEADSLRSTMLRIFPKERRKRGDGHHRAADRRQPPRHRRRDPGGADRRHRPGPVHGGHRRARLSRARNLSPAAVVGDRTGRSGTRRSQPRRCMPR
jgi:predicted PurR-regulated permease PerM